MKKIEMTPDERAAACKKNREYNDDIYLEPVSEIEKEDRGTDIVMHITEDSKEFLEDSRIQGILNKYCKFLPVNIEFGIIYQLNFY